MWVLAALGCKHAAPVPPAEEASDLARAWYLTARVAGERGDLATAERAWTWVVRLDPESPAGWAGLVDVWLARLDDPAAIADGVGGLVSAMRASCRYATVDAWFDAHPQLAREPRWSGVAEEARGFLAEPAAGPCHPDVLRAAAEREGCAGWRRLWEVAPGDPALRTGREACPELPSQAGEAP